MDPSVVFEAERAFRGVNRSLLEAVMEDDAQRCAAAIAAAQNVNYQDEDGMAALHHAAANGARSCIRLLVACGQCDYMLQDRSGRYASDLAIEWARDYAVGRLLTKHQIRQAREQGVPAALPPVRFKMVPRA